MNKLDPVNSKCGSSAHRDSSLSTERMPMAERKSSRNKPRYARRTLRIDTHGRYPDEVGMIVNKALLDAHLESNYTIVQFIHGKGAGKMRTAIRKELEQQNLGVIKSDESVTWFYIDRQPEEAYIELVLTKGRSKEKPIRDDVRHQLWRINILGKDGLNVNCSNATQAEWVRDVLELHVKNRGGKVEHLDELRLCYHTDRVQQPE